MTSTPSAKISIQKNQKAQNSGKAGVLSPKGYARKIQETYGNLVFDLCRSLLANDKGAERAFRLIMTKFQNVRKSHQFVRYEKSWVLAETCQTLLELYPRETTPLSAEQQIRLDASSDMENRMHAFEDVFHRLEPIDQIVLLLKDKFGLEYAEIAAALETPEGALKVRRQQALRTLEDWLWKEK